jgi:hypothetical protein
VRDGQDAHLHEWTVGGRRYGQPEPDEPEYEVDDEAKLTLREAAPVEGARFEYVYDLGDSWTHEVIVEEIEPPDPEFRSPECLAGERACPPRTAAAHPATRNFWRRSAIPGIRSTKTISTGSVDGSTLRRSTWLR